jgi:hypothetical protein
MVDRVGNCAGWQRILEIDPLDTIQSFELPPAMFVPSRLFSSQKTQLFRISQALLVDLDYDRSDARRLARPQWDVISATIPLQDQLTF